MFMMNDEIKMVGKIPVSGYHVHNMINCRSAIYVSGYHPR